ncbi:MAG TPA: hypothetical protein VK668_20950 [Mucilaginibacter sp.]|nr:hypothetical protein [Mucilaginibacter sp.]
MGKDLHPSIMPFILEKLHSHQNVVSVENISTKEHYMYRLVRRSGCDVVVLVSDAYHFGEFDYLSKPSELNEGGFILIAKPESSFPADIQHHLKVDKIIIGKIGILLGALRIKEFWNYEKPKDVLKK